MKIYKLRRNQFLPTDLKTAWDFFSSPSNLAIITPRQLNFKIRSISGGNKMHATQIICYHVTVLPLIRLKWVTEITQVQEPRYFVDEQQRGPYKLWHHKHTFEEVPGGIEAIDEVDYALPMGWLGQIAHALFVEREVNRIFDYRSKVLNKHFGGS